MSATQNPHVDGQSGFAPLKDLMATALGIFGDYSPDTADGSLAHLLLFFANGVIDEVRAHPYWPTDTTLDYYTHPSDRRPVSDQIMVHGIAAMYAAQQGSGKAPLLMGQYYKVMNRVLWQNLNGNTPIRVKVVDRPGIDPINGIDANASGRNLLLRQSNPSALNEE